MKKYVILDMSDNPNGDSVFRIKALKTFTLESGKEVLRGDLGGYISKKSNLSQEGNCWVESYASVRGDAKVLDSAYVGGSARVSGNAEISGKANVIGYSEVSGNAKVMDRCILDKNAKIGWLTILKDDTYITDSAIIAADITIEGNLTIGLSAAITSSEDLILYENVGEKSTDIIVFMTKDGVIMVSHMGKVLSLNAFKSNLDMINPTGEYIPEYLAIINNIAQRFNRLNLDDDKYDLTNESKMIGNKEVYRIKALKDFGAIKKDDLGGFVESKKNLSQDSNCWVSEEASVMDNALVSGNALVLGEAEVSENAQVFGDAHISGKAKIKGVSKVYDRAIVSGNVCLKDNSKVYDNANLLGDVLCLDDANIYSNAKIAGCVVLKGNSEIFGGALIKGNNIILVNPYIYNVTHFVAYSPIIKNRTKLTVYKTLKGIVAYENSIYFMEENSTKNKVTLEDAENIEHLFICSTTYVKELIEKYKKSNAFTDAEIERYESVLNIINIRFGLNK